jgi:hypothetical protein
MASWTLAVSDKAAFRKKAAFFKEGQLADAQVRTAIVPVSIIVSSMLQGICLRRVLLTLHPVRCQG